MTDQGLNHADGAQEDGWACGHPTATEHWVVNRESWWDTCLGTEGSLLLFLLLLSFPKVPRPVFHRVIKGHSSLHRVVKFPYLQNQVAISKLSAVLMG